MDGVGDYTRRLAVEVSRRGHRCWLLSLADPHVTEATAGEYKEADQTVVPFLRLPAAYSWPERVRQARRFLESSAPDWISWQIVLYGFDPRGLSFGLGRRFREIAGECRNQIMFHEIWIGLAKQTPWKRKLIGALQKSIIRGLVRELRPLAVHTQTPLYRHLLTGLNCRAQLLPLFGNIALAAQPGPEWLPENWPKGQAPLPPAERDSWLVFVLFGSIHPEWDAEDFRQRASAATQSTGKKCLLISIGRHGPAGEIALERLRRDEGDSWRLLELGPQPEEVVSQWLMAADVGVATVPLEYVFKSGTAIAMIEHGLPVIVTRPSFCYSHTPAEVLSVGMKNVQSDFNLDRVKKSKPESLLPVVASQFLNDLTSVDSRS